MQKDTSRHLFRTLRLVSLIVLVGFALLFFFDKFTPWSHQRVSNFFFPATPMASSPEAAMPLVPGDTKNFTVEDARKFLESDDVVAKVIRAQITTTTVNPVKP